MLLAGCASMHGLKPQHTRWTNRRCSRSAASPACASIPPRGRTGLVEGLADPQLDALVEEALAGNPGLAIADARADAALAAAGIADSAREPSLDGTASVAGAKIPTTLLPEPFGGSFGVAKYGILDFKWDLDLWGGKRAAWEAAVGNARAAQVESQAARLMLSAEVVGAYAALGDAYAQRDLAREELQRAQAFGQLTAQRVRPASTASSSRPRSMRKSPTRRRNSPPPTTACARPASRSRCCSAAARIARSISRVRSRCPRARSRCLPIFRPNCSAIVPT